MSGTIAAMQSKQAEILRLETALDKLITVYSDVPLRGKSSYSDITKSREELNEEDRQAFREAIEQGTLQAFQVSPPHGPRFFSTQRVTIQVKGQSEAILIPNRAERKNMAARR